MKTDILIKALNAYPEIPLIHAMKFYRALVEAGLTSSADTAKPVVRDLVAFVPLHPRIGPLWSETLPADSDTGTRPHSYPWLALYADRTTRSGHTEEEGTMNPFDCLIRQVLAHKEPEKRSSTVRVDPYDRILAVQRMTRGESPTALAREMGVSKGAVLSWKRNALRANAE